jgi:hypothetical protein
MTWADAFQLCCDQLPLIAKPLPPDYWKDSDWQSRVHQLFADEERLKPAIDRTMRQFCERLSWPDLPAGPLNFLVGCRLMSARGLLEILLVEPRVIQEPHGVTDCELRAWLFLDTWNQWRADEFLKLQALASLSGTLYRLPPLPPKSN